jgi:hypothetical protein
VGVEHVPHRGVVDLRAAELAASDPEAIALIGPYRSAAVAEAVEATAPVGLPLLAPVATPAAGARNSGGCAAAITRRTTGEASGTPTVRGAGRSDAPARGRARRPRPQTRAAGS